MPPISWYRMLLLSRLMRRVRDVAKILVANRISAVPVIDGQGKLVGIVSEGDLMRRSEIGTERIRSWWLGALSENLALTDEFVRSHSRAANDVMTRAVVTAKPNDTLGHIAALLEKNHIKRVPIVSDGKIVGIVSRANLVQALASLTEGRMETTAMSDAKLRGQAFARMQEAPRTGPPCPMSSCMTEPSSCGGPSVPKRTKRCSDWR